MLKLAIDAALDLNGQLGWTARQRLTAARAALDLPVDAQPAPAPVVGAPASPTTRPSRRADARWVRRCITGKYWTLAEAALDAGFVAKRNGTGHVRFERGIYAFSLSTTVKDGNGHGFENARAAARRAGVRV